MKNQIRTTVTFNRCIQDPGEQFDNFVTDLRILVKDCGYAGKDHMFRYAIVLRSSYAAVHDKCPEKGHELTLNMAISIGQNYETSQKRMRAISVDEKPKVDVVNIGGTFEELVTVHVDQKPLFSGHASTQLGLVERMYTVANELDKYTELRQTIRTLRGTCSLNMDSTVPPVVQGPRRQLKEHKIYKIEADGHITKVTDPTDWVSSMVTVSRNGKLKICSDSKDLDKAIRRQHYPIPTVELVVASMPGAKVFPKIGAKSGFLQIKLDYESTFNTPVGRYRWLSLPFGINRHQRSTSKSWTTC